MENKESNPALKATFEQVIKASVKDAKKKSAPKTKPDKAGKKG